MVQALDDLKFPSDLRMVDRRALAADENECRQMLHTALLQNAPAAVCYPQGHGAGVAVNSELRGVPLGQREVRRTVTPSRRLNVAILVFGTLLSGCLVAAQRLDATVANMRFVKPLDERLFIELANDHDVLVTLEDGCIKGGAGSACVEYLLTAGVCRPTLQLGFDDRFMQQGTAQELLIACRLDAEGIYQSIGDFLSRLNAGSATAVAGGVA
ncbi:transketolase C-terminal domain-containing protein [Pseudomonas kitaguniensis]|uniref:transketolase C-terminal domain-containing protein n=1 Tax=Pseudomonas kitaguniensis TaxID=2607908 RepID=UPI003D0643FC